MVLLCATEDEPVIWIDPRGRQFRRAELVVVVFRGVDEWDRMFASATQPVCLHVMRTRTDVIDLAQASRLVLRRMRSLQMRKRSAARRSRPSRQPHQQQLERP